MLLAEGKKAEALRCLAEAHDKAPNHAFYKKPAAMILARLGGTP